MDELEVRSEAEKWAESLYLSDQEWKDILIEEYIERKVMPYRYLIMSNLEIN